MQLLTLKISKIALFVTTCLFSFTFSSCNKAIEKAKPVVSQVVGVAGRTAIETATKRTVNTGIDSIEKNINL